MTLKKKKTLIKGVKEKIKRSFTKAGEKSKKKKKRTKKKKKYTIAYFRFSSAVYRIYQSVS